eukprot:TRINITY_DN16304_c0_g1_i5.p2 TRINITY_DN16304_c0_g1~~TRINITY_DN16304_c0_g1_i5.p2  ORF type:complete len:242 (-),score=-4.68 TRINITY_DN16304_c0_g1_i5:560-1285(-)
MELSRFKLQKNNFWIRWFLIICNIYNYNKKKQKEQNIYQLEIIIAQSTGALYFNIFKNIYLQKSSSLKQAINFILQGNQFNKNKYYEKQICWFISSLANYEIYIFFRKIRSKQLLNFQSNFLYFGAQNVQQIFYKYFLLLRQYLQIVEIFSFILQFQLFFLNRNYEQICILYEINILQWQLTLLQQQYITFSNNKSQQKYQHVHFQLKIIDCFHSKILVCQNTYQGILQILKNYCSLVSIA